MQTVAVFLACLAVASAANSYTYRVPSADSAVIESHRLGGSFAYSTSEGHAVGVVSPVVQNVVSPVATTYSVNGVPVVNNNVAVVRSGVQYANLHNLNNVAYVRSGNTVYNTPAAVQYSNLYNYNNLGYYPAVSSVVV